MTTIIIDSDGGRILTDSRISWCEGDYSLFGVFGLNKVLKHYDGYLKCHKVGKVHITGAGSRTIFNEVVAAISNRVPLPDVFNMDDKYSRTTVLLNIKTELGVHTLQLDVKRKTSLFNRNRYVIKRSWFKNKNICIGSGSDFVMDSYDREDQDSKYAKDFTHAMYVACVRDPFSGGDIKEYKL